MRSPAGWLAATFGLARAAPAAAARPERPVRVIVPHAPGGPTDVAARPISSRLDERLSQTACLTSPSR